MTTTQNIIKQESNFSDLSPLKGSSCHAIFLARGLDTTILDGYNKAILHSKSLLCPVLIFRDVFGKPLIRKYLPDHNGQLHDMDFPAYFYCHEIGPPCLIEKVLFFKDPIEHLSYLQIHYPISKTTLCLSIHPKSPITEISNLRMHFNNARFVSFIPNIDKADILVNLKLSLALAGMGHEIEIADNKVKLIIQGKAFNYHLDKIEKNIIPFVKWKKQQPLLFKTPPKKYQSFNSMLNDHY